MRIIFITLLSLAVVFAVTACGGKAYKGAATISGSGVVAYQTFNDVYGIIEDNIDAFSPRDVTRLRAAGETLQCVKVDVYLLMVERGSALELVKDLPELIFLYEKAKASYILASGVIMSEIDEFGLSDQVTLYTFQDTCRTFDSAIEDALNNAYLEDAERKKLVRDIVGFVLLVGKSAIPLIIL
jgi:hypothetical protein